VNDRENARRDREGRGVACHDYYMARPAKARCGETMVSLDGVLKALRGKRFVAPTEDDAIIVYGAAFAEYLEQQHSEGNLR
jgi:hypothetical protein